VQILIGQGFDMRPDPVTQFVPQEQITDFLGDIADVIEDVANRMPDHGEFVRQLPPSTPPAQASAAPANVSFTLRYERGETTQ
jgi:tryptophan halogenase